MFMNLLNIFVSMYVLVACRVREVVKNAENIIFSHDGPPRKQIHLESSHKPNIYGKNRF